MSIILKVEFWNIPENETLRKELPRVVETALVEEYSRVGKIHPDVKVELLDAYAMATELDRLASGKR